MDTVNTILQCYPAEDVQMIKSLVMGATILNGLFLLLIFVVGCRR